MKFINNKKFTYLNVELIYKQQKQKKSLHRKVNTGHFELGVLISNNEIVILPVSL